MGSEPDLIYFDCPQPLGDLVGTSVKIRGETWNLIDYGDTIPAIDADPIWDAYGKSLAEKNKCLAIHLSADLIMSKEKGRVAHGSECVWELARQIRWEQYQQALVSQEQLGPATNNDPLVVAELRSQAHDILNPNHDRDHKSMLCFLRLR